VIAVCAVAAGNASAENEFVESGGAVYIGPSPGTKLTGSKVLNTEVVTGTKMLLTTTIAGVKIVTEATGYSCIECTIENSGTNAIGHGHVKATGVHVIEPAQCEDGSSTVESKPVTATLGMNKAGTKATVRFAPTSGTTFEITELKGAECAIAGTYKVTGTVFAEVVNVTGVFAKSQELVTSQAIQQSAGTANSLSFGANPAYGSGIARGSLEGVSEWAAKEK